VFVRARELAERASETEPAFQALWGHWMVTAGLGRVDDARRIGGELLTLAERTSDRALLLQAHHAMWATSFWLGELTAVEHHVERGIGLYDPEHDRPLAFLYGGHDPASCGRQFTIWTHWLAGRPMQAATVGEVALTRARQLGQPVSLAQVLAWRCALFFFERNGPAAVYEAQRLRDLATERELPPWHAAAVIFDGWGRSEGGDGTAGIEQIRHGLRAARTTGTLMPLEPLYLMLLAEACLKHRRFEEGPAGHG
jgi:predicted ATPase